MVDYEEIARASLAAVNMPPERRAIEFDRIVNAMQTEIADARKWGIPWDEVEERLNTMAELNVSMLRMHYPSP